MISINVKWGKEQFNNVEVNTAEEALIFKSQMYALSNVPVDKQKIMIKGKILKDDDNLTKVGLTNGMTIMMMGTAEGNQLKEPEKPIVFFEDMSAAEKARALNQALAIVIPPGLENMGNTCYMASTFQVLKRVNELKAALIQLRSQTTQSQLQQGNPDLKLAVTGGYLMNQLDQVVPSIKPASFVQALQQAYPIYAETDDHGHPKQQDADECFQSILQSWRNPLRNSNQNQEDVIGNLFEIELETELICAEVPDEPTTVQKEKVLRLSCHIDNNGNPINMLFEGLKISLEGDIEKRSPTLGRDAVYHKKSKINKLPAYLCVQFVRFYWKQSSNSSGTDAGKAKILRSVSFPRTLDIWEFCTDELKKSLDLGREFETKQREAEDTKNLTNKDQDVDMKEESKDEKPKLVGAAAKLAMKQDQIKQEDEKLYRPHGQGLDTGAYQLVGVVTHKGRSAEGGHYIGWVHASGDDWLRCDDDIVTVVKTEDIMSLRGGGDWHTAYLCLYRKIEVTKNM